eukprot:8148476-Prorocentrum_lima.AAC.1
MCIRDSHGSGRPHLHVLFWLDDLALLLDEVSATTPPADSTMHGYVIGSQCDRDGKSMWPVFAGAS